METTCWCVLRAKGYKSAHYLANTKATVPETVPGGWIHGVCTTYLYTLPMQDLSY